MADMLATGLAHLGSQRHAHMTREVEYQRGSDRITLSATIGRTNFEQIDDAQRLLRSEARDYLIRTADLTVLGVTFKPERGHRIRETIGHLVHTYEVMAPPGEQPFRYSDQYQNTIRVHTKHVGTEEA